MPSIRACLLIHAMRLLRVRRALDGPERIRRTIAADRRKGPAPLPPQLRERLCVGEEVYDGRKGHTLAPRAGQPTRQLLYLHGGGWARPIADPHWELIAKLVDLLDCSITVPMYPLSPERTARDTHAWLLSLYADRASAPDLTLMGDSSGGNLALSLAMRARDHGLPKPSRLVLLSPALDATVTDPAIDALDRLDPIVPARGLRTLTRMFAGGIDLRDPLVSPLFGTLDGLPPIALFTGTREILNADAHRLRTKAAADGCPLNWHEYPACRTSGPCSRSPKPSALGEIAAFVTGVPAPSRGV